MIWPDQNEVDLIDNQYRHKDGTRYSRVTEVSKLCDTNPQRLINWNVEQEREAVFNAFGSALAEGVPAYLDGFIKAVRARLGAERAGLKAMRKAGDHGTAVHQELRSWLDERITGQTRIPVEMSPEVARGFGLARDWYEGSGLRPLKCEHKIWSNPLGVAGTVDHFAECPERGVGILDFKTSNYVMTSHHVQTAGYKLIAQKWVDVRWVQILHIPKGRSLKVVEMGDTYDGRLTYYDLSRCFQAALTIHQALAKRPGPEARGGSGDSRPQEATA